jgi:hypothetical protein
MSAIAPIATELLRGNEMTRWANTRQNLTLSEAGETGVSFNLDCQRGCRNFQFEGPFSPLGRQKQCENDPRLCDAHSNCSRNGKDEARRSRWGQEEEEMNFNYVVGRCIAAAFVGFVAAMPTTATQAAPKWKLPEGVKSIEVNGYDMAYQETGSGSPLVLVHGALTDYRYWYLLVPEFAKNYRVIAVSLRHYYPEKWDGNGADFSYEQHAADVADFIKKLNLGKVHLLGHSRGGGVVVNVAKAHPEVIKTLVLADATGFESMLPKTAEDEKVANFSKELRETLQKNLSDGNIDLAAQMFVDSLNGPGTWAGRPPELRQVRQSRNSDPDECSPSDKLRTGRKI